jgi:hypothetical protein
VLECEYWKVEYAFLVVVKSCRKVGYVLVVVKSCHAVFCANLICIFFFFFAFSDGARILGYAVAVYDYAATSTSQVTLKLNDRIAILSKNGQDKGWWKGENLRTQKV